MASLVAWKTVNVIELRTPIRTSDDVGRVLQRQARAVEVHRGRQRGRQPGPREKLLDGGGALRGVRDACRERGVEELGDRGARRDGQRELGIAREPAREVAR